MLSRVYWTQIPHFNDTLSCGINSLSKIHLGSNQWQILECSVRLGACWNFAIISPREHHVSFIFSCWQSLPLFLKHKNKLIWGLSFSFSFLWAVYRLWVKKYNTPSSIVMLCIFMSYVLANFIQQVLWDSSVRTFCVSFFQCRETFWIHSSGNSKSNQCECHPCSSGEGDPMRSWVRTLSAVRRVHGFVDAASVTLRGRWCDVNHFRDEASEADRPVVELRFELGPSAPDPLFSETSWVPVGIVSNSGKPTLHLHYSFLGF